MLSNQSLTVTKRPGVQVARNAPVPASNNQGSEIAAPELRLAPEIRLENVESADK